MLSSADQLAACLKPGFFPAAFQIPTSLHVAAEEEEVHMLWPVNKTGHMQQSVKLPA